jgi:hypothetical protein
MGGAAAVGWRISAGARLWWAVLMATAISSRDGASFVVAKA